MVAGDAVFQVFQTLFQVFHLDVAKLDKGCCICFNDIICMLQAYVSSVSAILDVCFKCVYLDVAYVAIALLACFKRMF